MRLYKGQVPAVARELAKLLTEGGDLEVEARDMPEFEEDISSVLNEYIRLEREIINEARDRISRRGGRGSVGREKNKIARKKGVDDIFDDPVGYIINQLIQIFFGSPFVAEVYSLDRHLRKNMAPVLKKHMSVDEELDEEVRDKIKNLEEGSQAWDIEYQKAMGKLKRTRDLED